MSNKTPPNSLASNKRPRNSTASKDGLPDLREMFPDYYVNGPDQHDQSAGYKRNVEGFNSKSPGTGNQGIETVKPQFSSVPTIRIHAVGSDQGDGSQGDESQEQEQKAEERGRGQKPGLRGRMMNMFKSEESQKKSQQPLDEQVQAQAQAHQSPYQHPPATDIREEIKEMNNRIRKLERCNESMRTFISSFQRITQGVKELNSNTAIANTWLQEIGSKYWPANQDLSVRYGG